jgi:hypothetical protein
MSGTKTRRTVSTAGRAWLSTGADPQTVARRAGHSVAVLLRVYAKFINDSDDTINAKIAARLREGRSWILSTYRPHALDRRRDPAGQNETKGMLGREGRSLNASGP